LENSDVVGFAKLMLRSCNMIISSFSALKPCISLIIRAVGDGLGGPEVVLTSDRTLMSDYHNNEFLGFGTCAPPNVIPDSLYSYMFFPPMRSKHGMPVAAPYGLRKVEATLLKGGFSVATVSPEEVEQYAPDAKVIGIHVMDPFGLGPASSTFAALFKKEPYLAIHFKSLLSRLALRRMNGNDIKIVVGGPGAWQFEYRPKFVEDYNIDCVVEGEGENVLRQIFQALLRGEPVPRHFKVGNESAPSLDQIPDIVNPSVNGLVEIGRGCCRHCEFCNVTLRPLRWFPPEKIMREMKVNVAGGVTSCCLHAEDVLLYGSKTTLPDEQRLVQLHESVMKHTQSLSWSHCSLAAVQANPKLVSRISDIVTARQAWWGAEIGIETGSARLARKIMPAKAHPFRAEEWPEVVRSAMGILHDSLLVPACTLIVGLPEETEDDILKTMELIDDLKSVRSLIVPLYFVPLGELTSEDWFHHAEMSDLHKQLLFQCAEHDFRWMRELIDWSIGGQWYGRFLRILMQVFGVIVKKKARQVEASVLV